MKVLIDTCVWSGILRRKNSDKILIKKFNDLLDDGLVKIIGPIRQELLSGIQDSKQFKHLEEVLFSFEDISLLTHHFIKAAEFSNICRIKGIQGSGIDFLICAVAYLENLIIFTVDKDFESYKKYLPIQLIK